MYKNWDTPAFFNISRKFFFVKKIILKHFSWQLIWPHIANFWRVKQSYTYLELHEKRMATVSKLTTKVHSWSPAGTKLGEMCWQTAKGNINWGGLEATSVGSVHNSRKGMVSSWTEKTTQYLEEEEKVVVFPYVHILNSGNWRPRPRDSKRPQNTQIYGRKSYSISKCRLGIFFSGGCCVVLLVVEKISICWVCHL